MIRTPSYITPGGTNTGLNPIISSPAIESPSSSSSLSFVSMASIYRSSSSPSSSIGVASPFRTQSPDQQSRKRTPGRIQKMLGDLYLLAGKAPEAVRA